VEDSSSNGTLVDGVHLGVQFKLEKHKKYRLTSDLEMEWIENQEMDRQKTIILSRRPTQILIDGSKDDRVVLGEAKLDYQDGNLQKRVRRLDHLPFSIGRHASNDLQIDSERVSQFHARIEMQNNQYILHDLGSTNGSFIEGKRVAKASLGANSRLRFGDFDLEFKIENREMIVCPKNGDSFFGMKSKNRKMKNLFGRVEAVAGTDVSVLVQGETGTGKELLARAIHDLSNRSSKAYIALNCAALPKELIESELFGHVRGAFTGALTDRIGAFEAANQGTLFLDEIGELDLNVQAKLLRCLETGEVKKIGSNQSQNVSVRIIAATHRDLFKMIREGLFREDLYYRIHGMPLWIPPLRERLEDLELLVPDILVQLKENAAVSPETILFLKEQHFTGNVRQLINMIRRALIENRLRQPLLDASQCRFLEIKDFNFLDDRQKNRESKNLKSQKEREELMLKLEEHNFNQSKTAKALAIPISTLHDRIKRLSIDLPRGRNASFKSRERIDRPL
jgi:transcriptional regulator with GAF, ATPase, and Fis domain